MRWSVLALTAVFAAGEQPAAQDSLAVQRLAGHDTNQQHWFGYATGVGEVGDEVLLLVGAPQAGPLATGAGYVFRREAPTGLFVQEAKLQGPVNALQGEDVALLEPSGVTAPSSHWLALVGGGQNGHLWRRGPTGAWTHRARIRPPGNTYEYGGRAVGGARDTARAGNAPPSGRGRGHVFSRAPDAPDDASGWLLDGGFSVVPFPGLSLEQGMLAMWAGLDGAVRLAFPVVTNPRAVVVFARDPRTGTWAEETRVFGSSLLP